MKKKSIKDIDIAGKRVVVRVDFNVPMDEKGRIADKTRITTTLPTIKYLINNGAKTVLMSHLGNPEGYDKSFSLEPIREALSQLLNMDIKMAADAIGEDTKKQVDSLQCGEVLLLENLRFHPEEKANDPEFAKILASYGDIYVNDAFGTSHRKHASTYGIGQYLPSVAGFLIERELKMLSRAVSDCEREFTAILGGAKVSSKIGVINNLFDEVDNILVGGGMAFTFIKAMGYGIGKSILDEEHIEYAKEILKSAKERKVNIVIPTDVVVASSFSNDAKDIRIVDIDSIPDDYLGLDVGPKTCEEFEKIIHRSKTVIWNGPMGAFEMPKFATGTKKVAFALARCDGTTIVGGGDSARAIDSFGLQSQMTHISTGGGASLKFLEGKELPGIEILMDKTVRQKMFAGNWKMNLTIREGVDLVNNLKMIDTDATVLVCPPYTMLPSVAQAAKDSHVRVGAQNMHFEDGGAYTGEVSADMLLELGVTHVILGHSERRMHFAESSEAVNKKVLKALEKGLVPIVCVGESLKERQQGRAAEIVAGQVAVALSGCTQPNKVVIAYEPIWAIGTGKTATPKDAQQVIGSIREKLRNIFGELAEEISILYGGSMNGDNVNQLMEQPDIDGGLIGSASLSYDKFRLLFNK